VNSGRSRVFLSHALLLKAMIGPKKVIGVERKTKGGREDEGRKGKKRSPQRKRKRGEEEEEEELFLPFLPLLPLPFFLFSFFFLL